MDKACSSFRGDRYQKANRASRGGLLAAQKGSLPHSSVDKESALQFRRPQFESWIGKVPWRRDRLSTPVFLGFPCGSAGKKSACNVGDLGSVPGLGRSPREEKVYPLQYSGLENSMDCLVRGVAKSRTQLSNFHFTFPPSFLHIADPCY